MGFTSFLRRAAIASYQSGAISVNQAAWVAGVSVAEWLQIAREHNLMTLLSPDDHESDVEAARDL